MISRPGSSLRARAAALRPAATPPTTTRAIGGLILLLHLLDEVENVEGADFAVGIEAVDGVLLVVERLEGSGETSHDEQFDVAPVEIEQLDHAAGAPGGRGAHDEGAEARAVDEIDLLQVEDDVFGSVGRQFAAFVAERRGFLTERDT